MDKNRGVKLHIEVISEDLKEKEFRSRRERMGKDVIAYYPFEGVEHRLHKT